MDHEGRASGTTDKRREAQHTGGKAWRTD
jgi:hypothetical protein